MNAELATSEQPQGAVKAYLMRRNLPMLLLRVRERLMRQFRSLLNEHNVTEQQWRVVRALYQNGKLEPREISELCTISSASMVGVLSRMQTARLVTKRRFTSDRRRVEVDLTPRGVKLAESLSDQIEARYREVEELVGGREVLEHVYTVVDSLLLKL